MKLIIYNYNLYFIRFCYKNYLLFLAKYILLKIKFYIFVFLINYYTENNKLLHGVKFFEQHYKISF